MSYGGHREHQRDLLSALSHSGRPGWPEWGPLRPWANCSPRETTAAPGTVRPEDFDSGGRERRSRQARPVSSAA